MKPYVQLPETYDCVFLNTKVLQKAYNRGYASYSPIGSKSSRKGDVCRKPIERSRSDLSMEEGLAPFI